MYLLYIKSDFNLDLAPNIAYYLEQNRDLLIKKSVEKRKGNRPWFELFRARSEEYLIQSPKIIIRQTGDSIIAAIDNVGYYSIDSTNVILLKKEYICEIDFLLALLNSRIIKFFYQEISQEGGRVLAQVKPIRVKSLPIPNASDLDKNMIKELVKESMSRRISDPIADISEIDNQIDRLVYQLYGLTYEEILIIDPETPITREEYESSN